MKLQSGPFEKIKNGSKTLEIRLNDEKRQLVKVGDNIEFSLISDSTQKMLTVVEGLFCFATFRDLYEAFDPAVYGRSTKDEYVNMYEYYSKEDEVKYGVLGIKIKVC